MKQVNCVFWRFTSENAKNIGRLIFVTFNIVLLCLSIAIGASTVFKSKIIAKNFIRELIFFTNISTSVVIIVRLWKSIKTEVSGELFFLTTKTKGKSIFQSVIYYQDHFVFTFCMLLAMTPLFYDAYVGIWKSVSHSIILVFFSTFQLSCTLKKIPLKLAAINREIRGILVNQSSTGNTWRNFKKDRINFDIRVLIVKWNREYDSIASEFSSVNDHYGTSLVFTTFSTFLNMTFSAFRCFVEIETSKQKIIIIGERFYYILGKTIRYNFEFPENFCMLLSLLISLIVVCRSCQKCKREVNNSAVANLLI
jgi:hypothetical protein